MMKPEVAGIMEVQIASLRSSDLLKNSVQVGDLMPRFALDDGHDHMVRSEDLLEGGPLVISFFRGTWCPYCRVELHALAEAKASIEARGAAIVCISPESPAERDDKLEQLLGLTLLYDRNNMVGRTFGLVYEFPPVLRDLYSNVFHNDIAKKNGVATWELPIPARFVVSRNGIVIDAKVDPDYRFRPEPAETLAMLDQLKTRL